jgi:hypothetical protein
MRWPHQKRVVDCLRDERTCAACRSAICKAVVDTIAVLLEQEIVR